LIVDELELQVSAPFVQCSVFKFWYFGAILGRSVDVAASVHRWVRTIPDGSIRDGPGSRDFRDAGAAECLGGRTATSAFTRVHSREEGRERP